MLDIQILPAATVTVLKLNGELTATGTSAVRAAALRLRQGGKLLVDLQGVRKVDRPGLAALVAPAGAGPLEGPQRAGWRCNTPSVVDLLHREGIDRLFPLQPVAPAAAANR